MTNPFAWFLGEVRRERLESRARLVKRLDRPWRVRRHHRGRLGRLDVALHDAILRPLHARDLADLLGRGRDHGRVVDATVAPEVDQQAPPTRRGAAALNDTPTFFVRAATTNDGDAIGDVHGAAWQVGFEHLLPRRVLGARGRPGGVTDGLMPLPACSTRRIWCSSPGATIGYWRSRTAGSPTDESADLEIFAFYCHPNAWGTGIAEYLMRETCAVLSTRASRAALWTPERGGPGAPVLRALRLRALRPNTHRARRRLAAGSGI